MVRRWSSPRLPWRPAHEEDAEDPRTFVLELGLGYLKPAPTRRRHEPAGPGLARIPRAQGRRQARAEQLARPVTPGVVLIVRRRRPRPRSERLHEDGRGATLALAAARLQFVKPTAVSERRATPSLPATGSPQPRVGYDYTTSSGDGSPDFRRLERHRSRQLRLRRYTPTKRQTDRTSHEPPSWPEVARRGGLLSRASARCCSSTLESLAYSVREGLRCHGRPECN